MTANLKSNPSGALSAETTVTPLDTPSTGEESPSTSGTWDFTAKETSPKDSPPTNSLRDNPATFVRIIQAFSAKLGTLVEWRKVELGDGREVYALCFPLVSWDIDPVSKSLKVKEHVGKELGEA